VRCSPDHHQSTHHLQDNSELQLTLRPLSSSLHLSWVPAWRSHFVRACSYSPVVMVKGKQSAPMARSACSRAPVSMHSKPSLRRGLAAPPGARPSTSTCQIPDQRSRCHAVNSGNAVPFSSAPVPTWLASHTWHQWVSVQEMDAKLQPLPQRSLMLQPCRRSTSSSHLQRRRAATPAATAEAPQPAAPPPQPAALQHGPPEPRPCPAAPQRRPGSHLGLDVCLMQ
jgi:hypothetical protein